ncbi:hypothetical protein C8N40_101404 [Pontibacter mucosus]|uniref:Uncharacterized protein n=1 Tax=Pontibacter mucosus TaxID=1649266 RepID=A0A2T5YTC9_9BACT|nr:hypothetical protein [Pontibacter mucosus]PTX22578.1 hypothetical protein C8N40_101404 [Pontibacter mucosus]
MDSGLYANAGAPQPFSITPSSAGYLSEVARWGKFLAIIGYVMIGIMVLAGLFAGAAMSMFLPQEAIGMAGGGFFTVLYLHRFSGKMQDALRLHDEELLASSFANLKSLFKFLGILTIIMLAFYGLGMLFMFLGMGIGAMM